MQTIQIEVQDSYIEKFLNLLQALPQNEIKIVDEKFQHILDHNIPDQVKVSSINEVRKRAYKAEERIKNGDYLTEDQYNEQMDEFFKTELDIQR